MAVQLSARHDGDIIYPEGKRNGLDEHLQFFLSSILLILWVLWVWVLVGLLVWCLLEQQIISLQAGENCCTAKHLYLEILGF